MKSYFCRFPSGLARIKPMLFPTPERIFYKGLPPSPNPPILFAFPSSVFDDILQGEPVTTIAFLTDKGRLG